MVWCPWNSTPLRGESLSTGRRHDAYRGPLVQEKNTFKNDSLCGSWVKEGFLECLACFVEDLSKNNVGVSSAVGLGRRMLCVWGKKFRFAD